MCIYIYNYTIIYLDCTSIISHFKSMRIPEVPYVFRKICVSQFKLGFLYFSWLFSTKQTWRRFGSLTRKPSSKIGRSLGDRPIIQIPGFAEWTFVWFFRCSSFSRWFMLIPCSQSKRNVESTCFFERNIQENIQYENVGSHPLARSFKTIVCVQPGDDP